MQEFVIISDGAPAEFGRASSGFVTVVTKSGTNNLKGTVHSFFQDDNLSTEAERADGTKEPEFDFSRIQAGFYPRRPDQRLQALLLHRTRLSRR